MRKIKLFFPKIKKDSDESVIKQIKPTLKSDKILVNGVLFTYILASLVSGVVDLVFFSGLSKSHYNIFAIKIAAPIVMSLLSLVITSGKAWCAIKVSQIDSLVSHLKNYGYNWTRNFRKVRVKWNIAHKLCATVSIITTISLSVVSIGSGVTRKANTLKLVDELIEQGTTFQALLNKTSQTKLDTIVSQSVDTTQDEAIEYVREHIAKINPELESYKNDRIAFEYKYGAGAVNSSRTDLPETEGKSASDYWTDRNQKINALLSQAGYGNLTGPQIKKLNRSQVEKALKENYMTIYSNSNKKAAMEGAEKIKDETTQEAEGWLDILNASNFQSKKQVIKENGKKDWEQALIVFDADPEKSIKVKVDSALMQLKAFRVEVENDTGDIGSSSKVFMLAGSAFEKIGQKEKTYNEITNRKNVKVSSFGATEIMIMTLICFFGILQEVLIALLTPKVVVTRKTLASFEPYFGTDFNENEFLYDLYRKYQNKGIISMAEFEAKALKCSTLSETPETLKDFISKSKKTRKKSTSKKVIINNNSETIIDKPIAYSANKDINKKVEETKQVYSEKVDELVNEIENVIGGN